MEWLTSLLGAALVVAVMADLLTTAVSVSHGAGPLARRLARWVWRAILAVHHRRSAPWLLVAGGPTILLLIIVAWVVLLIVGWSLVFGHPETLLAVQDGAPVPVLGRMRYAASLVIGRGSGGIRPGGDAYVILEPVAALTGLAIVSLSLAYVLPVVRGVVDKRALALYIATLGSTPAEILTNAWDGSSTRQLDLHLIALVPHVASVAQSHLAYPVIHYFHSAEPDTALGPSIATLDTALTANQLLHPDVRVDDTAVAPLRGAVDRFLRTLRLAFIDPADLAGDAEHDPLAATIESLAAAGIPLVEDREDVLRGQDADRVQLLRSYLAHDGWEHLDVLEERPAA